MIESKFKNTEIGLIPVDWEVLPFSKSFKDLRNNTFSRDMLNDEQGDIMNVHYGDVLIKYGEVLDFDKEQVPFITDSSKYTSYDALENGDIIMADTAEDETVGKVCEIMNIGNNVAVSGLHTIALRPLVKCAPRFLGYFLNSKIYHDQLLPLIQGTKVSSISKTPLKETCLVLPPLAEQRRIAEVLSEADELIKQWENVIAKKRDIKTGTMQLLLSGKKRLEGFKDDWVEKKLGEVCNVVDGTHQTPQYTNSGYQFYSVENVSSDDFENTKYISETEYKTLTQKYKIEKGDILMTRIGSIGVCKYVDWSPDAAFYVSLALLKPKTPDVDMRFISFYSNTKEFKDSILEHSLQFAIPQKINLGEISNVSIFLPPSLSEQRAIAEILSDMDEEIKTLEAKVEKLRNIKSGMMQQLLSGKIRLKGEEGDNVRQFVENNFGQMPNAAEDEAEFGL